jgi:hypothetical protein
LFVWYVQCLVAHILFVDLSEGCLTNQTSIFAVDLSHSHTCFNCVNRAVPRPRLVVSRAGDDLDMLHESE